MKIIEKSLTLTELARLMSIDSSKTGITDIDDLGLEIETPTGFKPVSSYIVKDRADAWKIGELIASSVHRVLYNGKWTFVKDVPGVQKLDRQIDVVDLEVPDGSCYIANGFVNHNTTPGGWN